MSCHSNDNLLVYKLVLENREQLAHEKIPSKEKYISSKNGEWQLNMHILGGKKRAYQECKQLIKLGIHPTMDGTLCQVNPFCTSCCALCSTTSLPSLINIHGVSILATNLVGQQPAVSV